MKLDQMIKKLLPTDEKFYSMLEESAHNLILVGEVLKKMPLAKNQHERVEVAHQVKDIEHQGDAITHKIFSELNSTFVTPMDREDIHTLASALDDVLDHIDGAAGRFALYKIDEVPQAMIKLIDVLVKAMAELESGVHQLRNLREFEKLQSVFRVINEYENHADTIFERAIADLFENERDAVKIIKLKEIYVGLETATDKCEDAANVLEAIYIKHA